MILENKTGQLSEQKFIFRYWPGYAKFLRTHCLLPYVQETLRISREINIPLLKYLNNLSDDDLVAMSLKSNEQFFLCVEENRLSEQLEKSVKLWVEDKLGVMKREDPTAEDINMAGYIRKKALMKFLPAYTSDVNEAIGIISEIDVYVTESDTALTNVYITLLKERISEQSHFSESITNTTPGLVFVFNIQDRLLLHANKNYHAFFGHSLNELQEHGREISLQTVHPDDLQNNYTSLEHFYEAPDAVVNTWELRLKDTSGAYRWKRTYASVFKRDENGIPIEIIGIILDIDTEKETAAKLLLREKQLLDAQKQANVGSYELDIETGKMDVTPQFEEIFGLSGEIDIHTFSRQIHPDDYPNITTQRAKAIHGAGVYDIEYRSLVNGKEKMIWEKGMASQRNGRKIMTGTTMDVTSRNDMLQQLVMSEQRYKQAQEISHMGNWMWDFETRQMEWSDEIYRIYEMAPQSVDTSDTISRYNHPEDKEMISAAIKHAVDTRQPFDFNYRIILNDGKIKILHAKGEIKHGTEKSYKIYGTLQDITEQKLAEKRLKDYQEFIKKITDVTPSVIAAYNVHSGKYTFINKAVEKLLGYPTEKIMDGGVSFFTSMIHPDDVAGLTEKNAKALEEANRLTAAVSEPISEFKYRMRHANGDYRWFHTYGTIFERNGKGEVESVLNVSIDITEQETAEQALFQKNLQLQQSNTSLEEYAYVASHDLKEPLRKISTFSDRLLSSLNGADSDENTKLYLGKIIDSSKRMQKMIGDLLSVSTISGNKSFETCDLNIILSEAIQPLEHKIEEVRASIEYDNLPVASVVASQFRQLFQNLINNSLKFIRDGVPSHIKITHAFINYKDVADHGLSKAKRYLKIEVTDNGIGFDNQYAGKIFAIFQRLHGRTEYEGTGIGLALCKKIVENHGGTIFAKGVPNQSATFTIIIPYYQ